MKKHRKTSKKRIIIIKRNKKAQFFIMAGIIIILVLYTLTINYNWIKETIELTDYPALRKIQTDELPKVITYGIYITTDPSKCKEPNPDPNCPIPLAEGFTTQFQEYSSNIDPNFGSVLILRDPYSGDIIIKNLLADKKWIKINTKDYKGDIVLKSVLSTTDTVEGIITLEGIDSIPVSAPITSLSEEFSKQNIGNVKELEICISDGTCRTINLATNKLSGTVTNSQDNEGNVYYDTCPSSLPNNNC